MTATGCGVSVSFDIRVSFIYIVVSHATTLIVTHLSICVCVPLRAGGGAGGHRCGRGAAGRGGGHAPTPAGPGRPRLGYLRTAAPGHRSCRQPGTWQMGMDTC